MHTHRFGDLIQTRIPSQPAGSPDLLLDRLERAIGGGPLPRRRAVQAIVGLALAASLGRLATTERALAARTQTATCTPPPSPTNNVSLVVGGDDRLAQTFLPEVGGKLSRVDLKLSVGGETSGDLVVQLAAVDDTGTPTNRILAATTVRSAALPVNTVAFVAAKFPKRRAAKIVAGTPYAIIVKRQGADNFFVPARVDNPCPEGALFESLSEKGKFDVQQSGAVDISFTAFVGYA